MIYDTAVIGTGPAGVSAALTLHANNKNFIWIGSKTFSDKVGRAERIANYPGLPMVTGAQMNEVFQRQCEALGISVDDRMVTAVMKLGDHYALTVGEDFVEARTVILATGVTAVGTLPGEAELVGNGVSYCATCDGFLYKGKTVCVICTAKRFEHEASFLAQIAEKLYYFPLYPNPELEEENVEILPGRPVRMNAEKGKFRSLTLNDGRTLEADGIFCLREAVSLGTLIPKLIVELGHIPVDRSMATNLPGIFAAGDCTGRPYQLTKAVGEGNVAAHSIVEYLAAAEAK